MADISSIKLPNNSTYNIKAKKIYYAECGTASTDIAKVVACDGFVLEKGAIIAIRFTDTGTTYPTSGNISLNINGTGAKNIVSKGSNIVLAYNWSWAFRANQTCIFVYDGTHFAWLNQDNNTTYNPMALGFGYGICTTAEATAAKVATLASYALVKNGIVSIKFTYAVPANATLNINNRGAKAIYYRGAKITADVIDKGDIATFVYDGANYQLLTINSNNPSTRIDLTGKTVDLNDLTLADGVSHIKKYIEKTAGGAANITNIPVADQPFILDVELIRWASTADYISKQTFISIGDKYIEYIRYCNSGIWENWVKQVFTDTTYTDMKGATSSVAGTNGLVPAPAAGKQTSFLRGDGTWVVPTNTWRGIQNNLTSDSATESLAAAQGKVLKGFIDKKRTMAYGTCTTAAATAAKVITVDSSTNWELVPGSMIMVKFSYTNTAQNPTFAVAGTAAKKIKYANNIITTGSLWTAGEANRESIYVYNGSEYVWLGHSADNNNDTIFGYCGTAGGTAAKGVSCTSYNLLAKSHLIVVVVYTNTAASTLTLNVNGRGAKPIYINGKPSSSTNYTLPAGTYEVYYDGTNYYFWTDGTLMSESYSINNSAKIQYNSTNQCIDFKFS